MPRLLFPPRNHPPGTFPYLLNWPRKSKDNFDKHTLFLRLVLLKPADEKTNQNKGCSSPEGAATDRGAVAGHLAEAEASFADA